MKKCFFVVIAIFLITPALFSQASGYFPQELGFRWYYADTVIISEDSTIGGINYNHTELALDTILGLPCYPMQTNSLTVSHYVALDGSDALICRALLPPPIDTVVGSRLEWYRMFKFGIVTSSWTIAEWDTTLQLNSVSLPVKIKISGQRLSLDTDVQVPAGSYSAAQFITKEEIGTQGGIFFIPFVTLVDTFWVAPNLWIVKHTRAPVTASIPVNGTTTVSIPGIKSELISLTPPDAVVESPIIPNRTSIGQNYPNPFNPSTVIHYQLSGNSFVSLKVYSLLGAEIATLYEGIQSAGYKSVTFNASDLPSGVYYYRLQAGAFSDVKRMILVR